MTDVRPMSTGGVGDDEFMTELNKALEDREATCAALDRHEEDLRALVEDLAHQPAPEHIAAALELLRPVWRMLLALGRSYCVGGVSSLVVTTDGSAAAPVMVELADNAVTLIVRKP